MRTRVRLCAVTAVVVLAASTALQAWAAPDVGTVLDAPPWLFKLSDLLVKSVTVQQSGGGEFVTYDFTITIKNRGAGKAAATTLGMISINDIMVSTTGAGVYAYVPTPEVPAGGQVAVTITRTVAPISKAFFVFVADAPVAGKPIGNLREAGAATSGKGNNSFVVAYNSAFGNPQTFTNSAAP